MDTRAMIITAMLRVAFSLPPGKRRTTLIASACAMNTAGIYAQELNLIVDVWQPYERLSSGGAEATG